MKLRDAIETRRSVRGFHHRKPNWRTIIRAIDAARFAPSAGGRFVMKFILVFDEKKIAKIAEATQQDFVGDAKYVVVAVSDDSKLVQSYGERGVRYSSQQAGAAIENFLLALTEERLVTTWVGHFYDEQIKEVLEIPEGMVVEAVFPIGRESKSLKSKRKEERKTKLDNFLYFDKWGEKKMKGYVKVSREVV